MGPLGALSRLWARELSVRARAPRDDGRDGVELDVRLSGAPAADLEQQQQQTQQQLQQQRRWTVQRSLGEVAAFAREVAALSSAQCVPAGLLGAPRFAWGGLAPRAGPVLVADVDALFVALGALGASAGAAGVRAPLLSGGAGPLPPRLEVLVSEFLEVCQARVRPAAGAEPVLLAGPLVKSALSVNSRVSALSTSVCVAQACALLSGVGVSLALGSLVPALVGAGLVFALLALDAYLSRPKAATRTFVLPALLVPVLGPLALAGYALHLSLLRRKAPRWFVLHETYLSYYEGVLSAQPRGVLLLDWRSRLSRGALCWRWRSLSVCASPDRSVTLTAASRPARRRWEAALARCFEELQRPPPAACRPLPGGSFAEHRGVPCQWYSTARPYFEDLVAALRAAQHEVLVAGWMLTPELALLRPPSSPLGARVEDELGACVARGVRVCVLLYREAAIALPNNSLHAKRRLSARGVEVLRHASPVRAAAAHTHLLGLGASSTWYSHHEKLVVVDGALAFVGGVDLAAGRFCDWQHALSDPEARVWEGKDYYNVAFKELEHLESFGADLLDRAQHPRMPWQDAHAAAGGGVAHDARRAFIQRWNSELRELAGAGGAAKRAFAPLEPLAPSAQATRLSVALAALAPYDAPGAALLRSCGPWSVPGASDDAVRHSYLELIGASKRCIYVENQFFCSDEVADALAARVARAARERDLAFRLTVVLPQWPAFEGSSPWDNTLTRLVLHHQHRCMDRVLAEAANGGPGQVRFCSLRKAGTLNGALVSSQVYVHSKIMLVDDEAAVVGSANLNLRSLQGDRDSELCLLVRSPDFARDMRAALFAQHLGLHPPACPGCRVCSLAHRHARAVDQSLLLQFPQLRDAREAHDLLAVRADANLDLLHKLLPAEQPSDEHVTIAAARAAAQRAAQLRLSDDERDALLDRIQGTIVATPLRFLRNEPYMVPSFAGDPLLKILPEESFL